MTRPGTGLLAIAVLVSGCAGPRPPAEIEPRAMTMRDFAKTDIDKVAEVHRAEALLHVRTLMEKLYRRNPREWKRTGHPSAEFVVARVFDGRRVPDFPELGGRRGADCIRLAFDADYRGDRVLAFAAGLASMIQRAYNDKTEFFVFDELDPQRLYNSARNVEVAAWILATARNARGEPLLLADSREGEPRNHSFERLFGKLIAQQDTLARIVADRSNRAIRTVVQRFVGAVFLPL